MNKFHLNMENFLKAVLPVRFFYLVKEIPNGFFMFGYCVSKQLVPQHPACLENRLVFVKSKLWSLLLICFLGAGLNSDSILI